MGCFPILEYDTEFIKDTSIILETKTLDLIYDKNALRYYTLKIRPLTPISKKGIKPLIKNRILNGIVKGEDVLSLNLICKNRYVN